MRKNILFITSCLLATTTFAENINTLPKALAIYRKQDITFKQRIKKAAMYFSPKDAETLIRLATYGIVQLELIVRPTPIPEKPYYLCY